MTKEKIILATLELASENGLRSISMSQIAKRAGIKKSSLYSHFASKEEIITEMYTFLRFKANANRETGTFDYGQYVEGKTLKEILMETVKSYDAMNHDPNMTMFYKVIVSEKVFNPIAAEIMVAENKTMIWATKQLFYAIMAKKIAYFDNIDAAALSFAMGIHSILDYQWDDSMAGSNESSGLLETFINEFCHIYSKE